MKTRKSIVTRFNRGVFLNQSDLARFSGGQVEIANCNSYSVGNVRSVSAHNGKLNIQISENIVGHGHPPSEWGIPSACEFIADLSAYEFAYIGTRRNGRKSRLFIQSRHYLHNGIQSITLFPSNRKPINPLTVDNLKAMWYWTTSVTVLPPKLKEESSLFWQRPKPWMREHIEAFGD